MEARDPTDRVANGPRVALTLYRRVSVQVSEAPAREPDAFECQSFMVTEQGSAADPA